MKATHEDKEAAGSATTMRSQIKTENKIDATKRVKAIESVV